MRLSILPCPVDDHRTFCQHVGYTTYMAYVKIYKITRVPWWSCFHMCGIGTKTDKQIHGIEQEAQRQSQVCRELLRNVYTITNQWQGGVMSCDIQPTQYIYIFTMSGNSLTPSFIAPIGFSNTHTKTLRNPALILTHPGMILSQIYTQPISPYSSYQYSKVKLSKISSSNCLTHIKTIFPILK